MIKHLAKEILIGFLLAGIISSTLFTSLLLPIPEAQAASNMCSAADIKGYLDDPNYEPRRVFLPGKDGGIKLDQAAEFIADMSDLTGAYYDEGRDQIVFVGTKETTIPKFDKDDLAVAIRSIFFAEANPGLKIEYPAPEAFGNGTPLTNNDEMNVNYMPSKYGDQGNESDQWKDDKEQMRDATLYGIEDTAFAKILFDADWKLKQYWIGYGKEHTDPNAPEKLRSNVSGYASFYDRYAAKGTNESSQKSVIRVWLRPQKITLKLDEAQDAFIFDQVKMELVTEHFFGENKDANWAAAAAEFAQHHTDNYDAFAAETPAYDQVKRLAKIVSVVKWLKDNNITTDFHWARHYEPAFVATPRKTKMIVADGQPPFMVAGSLNFPSQNVYNPGDGAGSSLKTSALSSQPTPADFHWNFNNNDQPYEAVAVSAEIFRNAGAYSSGVTDLSLETVGDIPLAFGRTYSSQMNERTYVSATSLGKGWEALPARLTDIDPTQAPACGSADQPSRFSFETQGGAYETFTFNCTSNTYQPDHPFYTSKLTRNTDGTIVYPLV